MCQIVDEPIMAARGQALAWLATFLTDPPQTDECLLWPFGRWANKGYGIRQVDLAREFGVSQFHIHRIVRGKAWEGDGRCAM